MIVLRKGEDCGNMAVLMEDKKGGHGRDIQEEGKKLVLRRVSLCAGVQGRRRICQLSPTYPIRHVSSRGGAYHKMVNPHETPPPAFAGQQRPRHNSREHTAVHVFQRMNKGLDTRGGGRGGGGEERDPPPADQSRARQLSYS